MVQVEAMKKQEVLPVELISKIKSKNFRTLKGLAIVFIVLGHYFDNIKILWVPAAFGLFIFSYSSAYFISLKYKESFNLRTYWLQKLHRLGVSILVINIFTGALFLLRGGDLWDWQTIIHFFCLTGFLEWFKLPVTNPFGGGRWYLTLLFIFYLIYPLANSLLYKKKYYFLLFFCLLFFISWVIYRETNTQLFGLWITGSGFIYGFIVGKFNIRMHRNVSTTLSVFLFVTIMLLNFVLRFKAFNLILLLVLFASMISSIEYKSFPYFLTAIGSFLSNYLLEIYLIHGELFFSITSNIYINLVYSSSIIICASILLSRISWFLNNITGIFT